MKLGQTLYLIQDSRSYVGNCVLWWCADGKGYTTDLDAAGLFTEEDAKAQHKSRNTDIPHRFRDINPLARRTVDMQKLPRKK